MNLNTHHLEIILAKHSDGFMATCAAFPSCKGIAKKESDAISKLSASISRYIGNLAKKSLDSILKTENYTDVITDPLNKTKNRKRLFSIIPNSTDQKNIFFKFENLELNKPEIFKKNLVKEESLKDDIDHLLDLANLTLTERDSLIDPFSSSIHAPWTQPMDDGMVFGFPLNFN